MNWTCIYAVCRKDMREAVRDSRVLTAILFPVLIGLLYSFMFPDESVQRIKVGIVSPDRTGLPAAIRDQAPDNVRLTYVTLPGTAQLRGQVRDDEVDVGLILPPDFDADVADGNSPAVQVVLPESSSFGGDYVAAILDRSLQAMSGLAPPARIQQVTLPAADAGSAAVGTLGVRATFILVAIILLLSMVAVYAVPSVLVDEVEKKTMDALTLIASTADVIAAKALFGISLSVVSVPILLAITRERPADMPVFAAIVILAAVVLVGIGLLFGGLFRTQQQMNTWSGVILLPLLAPAFTIGFAAPEPVNMVLSVIPTTHVFRLLTNAFADQTLYPHPAVSVAALVVWGVAAYGLLWWRLSRQEAAA